MAFTRLANGVTVGTISGVAIALIVWPLAVAISGADGGGARTVSSCRRVDVGVGR